jgi:hypothetical protein
MKVCTKCHIEKDESEYNRKRDGESNLRSICKACQKEYNQRYYKKPEVRNRTREYESNYRVINKSNVDKSKKKYRDNNREKCNARIRAYQTQWKERFLSSQKEMQKRYRESLHDVYVSYRLTQQGFTRQQIEKTPGLMIIERAILKIKRYGKQYKKNRNS